MQIAPLKNTSSLLCANLLIICALSRTNATVSKIDILSDCCILRNVYFQRGANSAAGKHVEFAYRKHRRLYVRYRVRMQQSSETDSQSALADAINNPDASVGVCCSHKVVAVGFNTLCYDASVGVLNPPHE